MVQPEPSASSMEAFVHEHRDLLETLAEGDNESAWLAEDILAWSRAEDPASQRVER